MDKKRIVSAIVNPVSLAIGAAGGATFALSGLWWVLPLTGAAWAAMTAVQLGSKEAPEPPRGLGPKHTARLNGLRGLRKRIEETLASANDTVRTCLADVPVSLAELDGKLADLLARQARIDAYLSQVHPQVSEAELARLEASRAQARTEDTRAKWASAVENKRAEIDARTRLADASDRIAAELAEIESSLETTLSKIVALENVHGNLSEEQQLGISGGVSDVLLRVTSLEQTLEEMAPPRGSQPGIKV